MIFIASLNYYKKTYFPLNHLNESVKSASHFSHLKQAGCHVLPIALTIRPVIKLSVIFIYCIWSYLTVFCIYSSKNFALYICYIYSIYYTIYCYYYFLLTTTITCWCKEEIEIVYTVFSSFKFVEFVTLQWLKTMSTAVCLFVFFDNKWRKEEGK